MIPRLPPTTPVDLTVTIGAKLRPYLTAWYQALKLPAETPETFLLRVVKEQTKLWWIAEASAVHTNEMVAVMEAEQEDQADIPTFESEL